MIFYFSGTGNSAWVARQIAKAQQEELLAIAEEINKNKEYALKDGEKVGFVFPVYAWGPPGIVLRFIRQLKMMLMPRMWRNRKYRMQWHVLTLSMANWPVGYT